MTKPAKYLKANAADRFRIDQSRIRRFPVRIRAAVFAAAMRSPWYRAQLAARGRVVTMSNYKRAFEIDLGDHIAQHIWGFGAYEPAELELIARIGQRRPTSCLLDVGANIGNHTVNLAGFFRQVVSYEPNPSTFAKLQRNVDLNGLTNVELIQRGLSIASRSAFLANDNPDNIGGARLTKSTAVGAVEIALGRGDDEGPILAAGEISCIKIDVEGHELEVLEGLKATIGRWNPVLVFEWDGGRTESPQSMQSVRDILYKYRIYELVWAKPGRNLAQRVLDRLYHGFEGHLVPLISLPARFCPAVVCIPESFDNEKLV